VELPSWNRGGLSGENLKRHIWAIPQGLDPFKAVPFEKSLQSANLAMQSYQRNHLQFSLPIANFAMLILQ
jgi:hypothetical protein